jgi:hypothetical protein
MCHKYIRDLNVFAVLISVFCISLCVEARDTQNIRLEDLIQMAAASREEISSIDITYEVNQTIPESLREKGGMNAPGYIERRLLVDFSTLSYYEERCLGDDSQRKGTRVLEAYDGESRMIFLTEKKIGGIDEQKVDKENLKQRCRENLPPLMAALMYPPKNDGIGIDDGSMVSLLKHGILRKKTETVDSCETYVVDAKYNGRLYATVWLDIKRGVIPLRAVMYGAKGEIDLTPKNCTSIN